jgi:hypothetical protein
LFNGERSPDPLALKKGIFARGEKVEPGFFLTNLRSEASASECRCDRDLRASVAAAPTDQGARKLPVV